MATAAPITGAPTRAPAILLNLMHRRAIEAQIDMHLQRVDLLIARLDRADMPGEDLEEDDHPGDPLDIAGEASSDDGRGLLPTQPMWAIDQSGEPINYREASRNHAAAEMGLVRSETGGWQQSPKPVGLTY